MNQQYDAADGPLISRYEPTAQLITALATVRGGGGAMWTWLGPISSNPEKLPLQVAIAHRLGLRPTHGDFTADTLQRISPGEAKALLGYLALDGIGRLTPPRPDAALASVLDCGLAAFGPHVRCYSNGDYHLAAIGQPQGRGHMPLTSATIDTGVICHDGDVGFAFWVDWED